MTKLRPAGSAHEALDRLLDQCGGVKMAADFEGVRAGTLYKMIDPDQGGEMQYRRVARLTEHFQAAAAAEHLARLAGGRFVPVPQAAALPNDIRVMCELTASSADAIGTFARAHGDGTWTRDELRHVRGELEELLTTVLGALARLDAIENGEGS